MAMGDLPDMHARSPVAPRYACSGPRAPRPRYACSKPRGPQALGIHIRQITNGHVTSIMYHPVPIVTAPVVLIPQVNVTLVHKVINTARNTATTAASYAEVTIIQSLIYSGA